MADFIQWCQNSALSQMIRAEPWPYPAIETLHLAGLILVFGSVLVVNLRIFGRVLRHSPTNEIARGAAPVTMFGLAAQFISGPLLFITSAMRFSENPSFWVKLCLLAVALAYHFFVHRPLTFREDVAAAMLRRSAAVSMALWMGVVLAGMGIELLST